MRKEPPSLSRRPLPALLREGSHVADRKLSKVNRLEIWRLSNGALALAHSKTIYGTISMLQKLRPKDSDTDLIFVGTDRSQYLTLAWDVETNQFETKQVFEDPGEKYMRDSQSQDKCLVDPTGKFMAMHLWEGVMNVLRLPMRRPISLRLDLLQQVRISELYIKASTFLYTETGQPKIAFLHRSSTDSFDSKLSTYYLTENDQNTQSSRFDPRRDRDFCIDIQDPAASMLIPVRSVQEVIKRHNFRNTESARAHLGGLLVVGETRLLYYDETTKVTVESALKEASSFAAWAEYDATHYFLADDYSRMHLLTILTDGAVVTGLDVQRIGWTSKASTLVYLGSNLLFVGSTVGDSQLFFVDFDSTKRSFLNLVQTFPNNAPILDFAVMDMGHREQDGLGSEYSSGQARIVTGSGAYRDGSLRSVRSGVGLEDIGILADLDHVRNLFSLKSHGSEKVDILLASLLTETRAFRFDPAGEIEEIESFAGMHLELETLLACNLPRGRILQVTSASATLLDAESGMLLAEWNAPEGKTITHASANPDWLLMSVDSASLISLDLKADLAVVFAKDLGKTDQVACIHVAPASGGVGVVGFWGSGTVSLVDLSNLEPIHGSSLRKTEDDASVPIHVALVQVMPPKLSGPTLFIAMEDGNVITYNVGKDFSLSGKKSVVLGNREARFHLLPQPGGLYNVFVTSEHPSLIYGSDGRIVYSAATAEDAACVCPFDSEAFPDSIVLATDTELKISFIDNQRQTHVRPLHMNETIRRIAYSPSEKMFGLGCVKRELVQGEEVVTSSFKLVDEVVFEKKGKPFQLEMAGETELVEAVIRAELPDAYGNPSERFIVGTSFLPDPEDPLSGVSGRILVFGVDSTRNPYLILSHELKGACRCLAVMDGKIVAALTKTVVICQYEETSDTTGHLTKLASYRPSTYPVNLAVEGSIIGVADVMKSMTTVEFVPGEDGTPPKLVERARHYQSAWSTAVSHIEDNSWLLADAQGNLTVLRSNPDGVTAEDKRRMEVTSEFNLGEMVNHIGKISVATSANAMIIPKAFLATVSC